MFHGNEHHAISLFDGIERDDVRMLQRGDRTCFAFEPCAAVGVVGEFFRENLESNIASEPGIECEIDCAHPALTELLADLVVCK